MSEIPPALYKQLQDALLSAFPSYSALAQMVRFGLGQNLAAITLGANLQEVVFALLEWATAQNQIPALLIAGAGGGLEGHGNRRSGVTSIAQTRVIPETHAAGPGQL